jgi:hypothetical protein
MKTSILLIAALSFAAAPDVAHAVPGGGSANQNSPQSTDTNGIARHGQPNASCEDAGVRPGQAEFAPGSAFNPDGTAGGKYAGEQPGINDKNDHSVSQYDVACLNQAR